MSWLAPAVVGVAQLASQGVAESSASHRELLRPVLAQYCFKCHGERKPKGGINLTKVDVTQDYQLWRGVLAVVESEAMPPENQRKQPSASARAILTRSIRSLLSDGAAMKDPGRPLLRRLNRRQYERTVQDLLYGLPVNVADRFPKDPQGYGFDTTGDVLFSSPLLIEKYLDVTEDLIADFSKREDLLAQWIPQKPATVASSSQAATLVLREFLSRAFRRPVTASELRSRVALVVAEVNRGVDFSTAMLSAVQSALLAPQFLFRVEKDRNSSKPWPLDGYELATRLSYFLWSSMPDDALRAAVARGDLQSEQGLKSQVDRMLDDPRSRALADDFAAQWLGFREIRRHAVDVRRFGGFREGIKNDLYEESARFFDHLIREDKSITLLLDAPYTYLNEQTAKHYGIAGVKGPEIRRVALPNRQRGGILGMASVLTATSYPLRTSPVQRGKWILENILGDPPSPPPPDAGVLPPDDKGRHNLTLRQQLERHRRDARCASCHSKMDPLGLALESYDGIGRWRTENHGRPINASTTMWDGQAVDGPVALKDWLMGREDAFLRTATRKLLIYALGRDVALPDEKVMDSIVAEVRMANGKVRALIKAVAMSYPFRHRRGPGGH